MEELSIVSLPSIVVGEGASSWVNRRICANVPSSQISPSLSDTSRKLHRPRGVVAVPLPAAEHADAPAAALPQLLQSGHRLGIGDGDGGDDSGKDGAGDTTGRRVGWGYRRASSPNPMRVGVRTLLCWGNVPSGSHAVGFEAGEDTRGGEEYDELCRCYVASAEEVRRVEKEKEKEKCDGVIKVVKGLLVKRIWDQTHRIVLPRQVLKMLYYLIIKRIITELLTEKCNASDTYDRSM